MQEFVTLQSKPLRVLVMRFVLCMYICIQVMCANMLRVYLCMRAARARQGVCHAYVCMYVCMFVRHDLYVNICKIL